MLKLALLLLLIWIAEVLMLTALVADRYYKANLQYEEDRSQAWLGDKTYNAIRARGDLIFEDFFVASGLYDSSFELFIPSAEERRRSLGMEDMGRSLFHLVNERIALGWYAVHQVILRLLQFSLWVPFFLVGLIPSVVDGLAMRQVKKANMIAVSSVVHRLALYAFLALVYLVLMALFYPLPVSPLFYPLVAGGLALLMATLVANLQKNL